MERATAGRPGTGNRVTGWVFKRQCHPFSAWSRWASTPLLMLPVWRRDLRWVVPVALWLTINPVITPPPADDRAFATRAIRGERMWMEGELVDRTVSALTAANTVLLAVGVLGAWRRNPAVTAAGTVASMAVTLPSWRRYAALYRRR